MAVFDIVEGQTHFKLVITEPDGTPVVLGAGSPPAADVTLLIGARDAPTEEIEGIAVAILDAEQGEVEISGLEALETNKAPYRARFRIVTGEGEDERVRFAPTGDQEADLWQVRPWFS